MGLVRDIWLEVTDGGIRRHFVKLIESNNKPGIPKTGNFLPRKSPRGRGGLQAPAWRRSQPLSQHPHISFDALFYHLQRVRTSPRLYPAIGIATNESSRIKIQGHLHELGGAGGGGCSRPLPFHHCALVYRLLETCCDPLFFPVNMVRKAPM